ncbi:MAG: helix-turn-helix domain-containing protein [Planctomycetota bacterium]
MTDDSRRRKRDRVTLRRDELDVLDSELPAVLTIDQLARCLQLSKSTLYHHVAQGRFRGAVKTGKPLRFWRDRALRAYFRGDR